MNGVTYMIPVVTFAYTLFINLDLFEAAGISELPTNRTQFLDAARKVTNQDNNVYAWAIPLILSNPNGANHDIMPWIWASGGRMLDSNGNPNINNPEVKSVFELIKTMYDEKLILPGAFSMDEEDKTHEFTNGRAAMVLNTLAHITIIRESNPDLNFTIVPVPPAEGATEKYGMDYASWGISISESTTHKEEAWKLVAFLMGKDVNARLASIANALPGNIDSEPDMVAADELFAKGFEIYKSSDIINEFDGMPYSEDLQRTLNEQVQLMLDGKQSVEEALENTQKAWDNLIK